jgi:hypothetical protein
MLNSNKSPKGGASSQTVVNTKLINKKVKPTLKSPNNRHKN